MTAPGIPMIVGAGPVGLAAALFLTRQGRKVRIVEMLDEPSDQSRALAVNPRTLEILEPLGITRQMLELGRRVIGVHAHHKDSSIAASVTLEEIHPIYPFMLALSQASTERLLARALRAAGGSVERGVKLVECWNMPEGVEAVLEHGGSGTRETVMSPWLLAADGAHSTAREKVGVDFPGSALEDDWHLADAPMRTRLADDHGHVFFLSSGTFLFMLPVIDDALRDHPGPPIWRAISNRPDPLSLLVDAEQAGQPVWESSFHVSHWMVASMSVGGIHFAGDAAHIHSPIGARGMNLGIEDAWVFAELVKKNRLDKYHSLRHPIDGRVVRMVERLTRMVAAESLLTRMVRDAAFPVAVKAPILRGRVLAAVTGLDHKLSAGGESSKAGGTLR